MDKQKVLIADDEAPIREILKIYCDKEGFDVIEAADGAEAILKVQSEKPDIIILDIMMPVMDGLEVCKQVRKMSDIPIIMLTTAFWGWKSARTIILPSRSTTARLSQGLKPFCAEARW